MSLPFDLGPRPHLGYTQSQIDRVAERRLDRDWLAARMTDASTRAYVIGGELIVLKAGNGVNDPAFTLEQARALGQLHRDGVPRPVRRRGAFRHRHRAGAAPRR